MQVALKHIYRTSLTILGVVSLLAGFVMLFLPAPGILFVILGLTILSRQYVWAAVTLRWAQGTLDRLRGRTAMARCVNR